jgi:hypothetical protein
MWILYPARFVSVLGYQLSVAIVFDVLLDVLVEVESLDVDVELVEVELVEVELVEVEPLVVPDITVNVTGIQTFPPADAATLMVVV